MILFLTIQGTYKEIIVGLFKEHILLKEISIKSTDASKQLITIINNLLHQYQFSLDNVAFISASQGPGPFTTLRSILTTVNALSFALQIPLIGIDSLQAVAQEFDNNNYPYQVTLLDGFNNDVYFCIKNKIQNQHNTGYEKIDILLTRLNKQINSNDTEQIYFIGNGTHLYQNKIKTLLQSHAVVPSSIPLFYSLHYMGKISLALWYSHTTTQQLLPLYLKKHHAELL